MTRIFSLLCLMLSVIVSAESEQEMFTQEEEYSFSQDIELSDFDDEDMIFDDESDAEILQSINDWDNEINDNEYSEDEEYISSSTDSLYKPERLSPKLILSPALKKQQNKNIDRHNSSIRLHKFNNKNISPTNKKRSLKGVGIDGKEEALINQLDNSDLMDFEKDIDIWDTDIDTFSTNDEIDHID